MKYNCESRKYGLDMVEWIAALEDFDKSKHKVGEIYCRITSNMPPLIGIAVYITTINGKRVVVIASTPVGDVTLFTKVYYPTKVEIAYHDYNEHGKSMMSIRVDDKFWSYEERFAGVPAQCGGIIANFGMDMSMPFLEQQNFKLLE